jgi:hypothetical protein
MGKAVGKMIDLYGRCSTSTLVYRRVNPKANDGLWDLTNPIVG